MTRCHVTQNPHDHIRHRTPKHPRKYKPPNEGILGKTLNPHAKISDHSLPFSLISSSHFFNFSLPFSVPHRFAPRPALTRHRLAPRPVRSKPPWRSLTSHRLPSTEAPSPPPRLSRILRRPRRLPLPPPPPPPHRRAARREKRSNPPRRGRRHLRRRRSMTTKMRRKRTCAEFAGTPATPRIRFVILAHAAGASNSCIRIVSFSGLITATRANARLHPLFFPPYFFDGVRRKLMCF